MPSGKEIPNSLKTLRLILKRFKNLVGLPVCMKHTWSVTVIVIFLFFVAQIVGLLIISQYISEFNEEKGDFEFKPLPFGQERPEVEPTSSFIPIMIAVLIGTVIAILLIRFKWFLVWKIWFFLAIWITVTISLAAFMSDTIAALIALVLAVLKVFRRTVIFNNLSEIFIYAGIAVILVPIMNMLSAVALLVIISVYDFWAVVKSGHMVELAKAQSKLKVFAGLQIPYKLPSLHKKIKKLKTKLPKIKIRTARKVKTAILGGGDIAFSLIFAGVAMKYLGGADIALGLQKALIIPVFTTIALGYLFYIGKKNKFYPAMPFLTAGCLLGFLVA
jgi:presenilin-like A22 family membrane protease